MDYLREITFIKIQAFYWLPSRRLIIFLYKEIISAPSSASLPFMPTFSLKSFFPSTSWNVSSSTTNNSNNIAICSSLDKFTFVKSDSILDNAGAVIPRLFATYCWLQPIACRSITMFFPNVIIMDNYERKLF